MKMVNNGGSNAMNLIDTKIQDIKDMIEKNSMSKISVEEKLTNNEELSLQ